MAYLIRIGNAEVIARDGVLGAHIKAEKLDDAPAYPGDELSHYVNSRAPSYTTWHFFGRRMEIVDFLFGAQGITISDTIVPLTRAHLARIEYAVDRYRTLYPKAKPGWCECLKCLEGVGPPGPRLVMDHDAAFDGDLARLLWMAFWIRNAMKHPNPAVETE